MSLTFRCPACGQKLRADASGAGKKAKCKCGQLVVIPQLPGSRRPPPTAPVPQQHPPQPIPPPPGGFEVVELGSVPLPPTKKPEIEYPRAELYDDYEEEDLPRRRSRDIRKRDDDYDEDDEPRSRNRRPRFRCPFCGSNEIPVTRSKVSVTGWVLMVVLLLFCFPLFWIGFFIKEEYMACHNCGIKLGG
jgi:hypothetical protein